MLGSTVTLLLLSVALGWTAIRKGGVHPSDLSIALLAIGTLSLLYWTFSKRQAGPPLPRWLGCPILALPTYLLFQLSPLPIPLLRFLSPSRAGLTAAFTPLLGEVQLAPLTTTPVQTLVWLFTVLACIAVFLLVRELASRWNLHPWIVLIPLLLISATEAVIGILQFFGGVSENSVTGTYTNHDHFSGLLEMTLPIALLYGVALTRQSPRHSSRKVPLFRIFLACGLWSLAAVLLFAINCSASRSGFLIAICVLLIVASFSVSFYLRSRVTRGVTLAAVVLSLLAIAVALPSPQLIDRFSISVFRDNTIVELRPHIWRDTFPLIAEFPIFGCGLGGFESNFMKFQTAGQAFEINMAHNDYLQYLADLGIVGFTILLAIVFGVFRQLFLNLRNQPAESTRFFLIACSGSLIAMLLHSFVDFNLHIPANMLTLCWIAGAGSAPSRQ